MSRIGLYVAVAVVIGTLQTGGRAQSADHALLTMKEITWESAPASLPQAAQAAVLEGDPAKEGPFTLRIRMPDGYRIPPHFHPAVEHVTVLQGTFILGMGDKVTTQTEKALNAGSFAYMPAGMRHFARTQADTIIQLHGIGPWSITYVNPSDDPRSNR